MSIRFVTTKFALDGEKEYKSAVKSIGETLSELRAEEKLIDEQFKGQANSLDALRAKYKNLSAQYDEQSKKVDLAKEQLDKYNAGLAECQAAVAAARRAIEATGSSVEELSRSTKTLTAEQKDLLDEYRQADSSLQKMQSGVHSMTLQYTNAQTAQLKLSRSLEDYSGYVAEAEASTDGLASSIDEYGKKTKDAADETGIFGDILNGNLLSDAISKGTDAVIGLLQEAIDKGTEYSRAMANLTAAGKTAGYTSAETTAAYERLYEIIGDEEASATAVTYIQRLGKSQQELMEITDLLSGAYIKFNGDLNLPGLAEALVQLKNTGEVTGEFQKYLEQANIDIDEFKDGLDHLPDGSARVNSALTLMSGQLSNVADDFREANPQIVEMNQAQLRLNQTMADFAEQAAPILTFIAEIGTGILWLVNQIGKLIESFFQLGKAERDASLSDVMVDTHSTNRKRSRDGSHASGLDYVPFDGYIAELHRGERVLTAAQNAEFAAYSASVAALSQPLSAPTPAPASSQAVSQRQSITLDATFVLGDATVARHLYPLMQSESRRRGTPLAGKEGT